MDGDAAGHAYALFGGGWWAPRGSVAGKERECTGRSGFRTIRDRTAAGPTVHDHMPFKAMTASDRPARMRERLAALAPSEIAIIDDSHRHAGHAGARDGRGHFSLRIVSGAFRGLRPLARHRLVYQALGDLMDSDIHALAIQALTPEEQA